MKTGKGYLPATQDREGLFACDPRQGRAICLVKTGKSYLPCEDREGLFACDPRQGRVICLQPKTGKGYLPATQDREGLFAL